jgi:hypothetical protein
LPWSNSPYFFGYVLNNIQFRHSTQDRGPVERPGESRVKAARPETKSEFQPIVTRAENYTMQNLKILDEHLFWGFGLCDLSRAEMLPGENDQIKRELC